MVHTEKKDAEPSGVKSIWRDSRFRRHFAGMWVNAFGNGVFNIVLPLLVLDRTHSFAAMGGVALATQLPKAFPGPLVGVLADRRSPRAMMLWAYLLQAGLVLTIPLAAGASVAAVWLIGLIAYAMNTIDLFARTATFVTIPRVYGDRRSKVNAAFASAWTSASVLGPAAGGFLLQVTSADVLMLLDSLTFLAIAAVVLTIGVPTTPGNASTAPIRKSLVEGLTWFRRAEGAGRFMSSIAAVAVVYAPLGTLAVFAVRDVYGDGPTEAGIVTSAAGAGLFLGTLVCQRLADRPKEPVMRRAAFWMAFGAALFAVPSWIGAAAAMLVVNLCGMVYAVSRSNLIQERVPMEHLGQTMTAVQSLESAVQPVSVAVVSAVLALAGPPGAAVFLTAFSVVAALLVLGGGRLLAPRTETVAPTTSRTPSTLNATASAAAHGGTR
ncbi:MFS transporter [Streptomyces sp. R302]|uniref:MFS transporter n=1 Tax=unclassified Streptomyces TaxID=2593676 RepID=UPI00145F5D70|nr:MULTISPECIES: MFS transporter [unclassified Streptomyces]NML48992.1 MFS transporter [Streptomyces sp. R301]NML77319.1 MFS transporter [Streptomyces sp. R302]